MSRLPARESEEGTSNQSEVIVPDLVREWLGPIEWNWSAALPQSRRVAIVSSRLPRLLDPNDPWLAGLRAVVEQVHEANCLAVIAKGTAGWELVFRCSLRRRVATICFQLPAKILHQGASSSCRISNEPTSPSGLVIHAWEISAEKSCRDGMPLNPDFAELPKPDRTAIAWADEIFVLRLRTGGNLHRLLKMRLQENGATVQLVDLPNLQTRKARDELIGLGANLWNPPNTKSPMPVATFEFSNLKSQISNPPPLLPCPPAQDWNFLTHTTRACPGPWPGQLRDDYLDSLLDARADADHSPLAALVRIISERRVRASSRAIRGKFSVVSFTAVPLAELPRLRTFRSHRARWDFEPYGIAIRRDWLEQLGARPVRYGDEALWKRLPIGDRPFFQLLPATPTVQQFNGSTAQPTPIDWSQEHEWRVFGDVDLSYASSDQVIVFVPSEPEARRLATVCPWPITVLNPQSRGRTRADTADANE